MTQTNSSLGFSVQLKTDFDTAIQRVTDALKVEGFGVLTEIDVKATLKKRIDVDFRPYKILGACNPELALAAFTNTPLSQVIVLLSDILTGFPDTFMCPPVLKVDQEIVMSFCIVF